jgi:hypothetical protein
MRTMELMARIAGAHARHDQMQRVVPEQWITLQESWLSGYDESDAVLKELEKHRVFTRR